MKCQFILCLGRVIKLPPFCPHPGLEEYTQRSRDRRVFRQFPFKTNLYMILTDMKYKKTCGFSCFILRSNKFENIAYLFHKFSPKMEVLSPILMAEHALIFPLSSDDNLSSGDNRWNAISSSTFGTWPKHSFQIRTHCSTDGGEFTRPISLRTWYFFPKKISLPASSRKMMITGTFLKRGFFSSYWTEHEKHPAKKKPRKCEKGTADDFGS